MRLRKDQNDSCLYHNADNFRTFHTIIKCFKRKNKKQESKSCRGIQHFYTSMFRIAVQSKMAKLSTPNKIYIKYHIWAMYAQKCRLTFSFNTSFEYNFVCTKIYHVRCIVILFPFNSPYIIDYNQGNNIKRVLQFYLANARLIRENDFHNALYILNRKNRQ